MPRAAIGVGLIADRKFQVMIRCNLSGCRGHQMGIEHADEVGGSDIADDPLDMAHGGDREEFSSAAFSVKWRLSERPHGAQQVARWAGIFKRSQG